MTPPTAPAEGNTAGRNRGNWLRAPGWRLVPLGLFQSIVAIAIGIIICLIIILLIADDPLTAFRAFVLGTFSTTYAFGSMLAVATVLVLTALAAAVSFRAGAFNIGTEGQLVLGGLAAAVVAQNIGLGGVGQVAALLASALIGALWVAVPAWLRVRYSTNEILTTLMFNYIAADVALFLVNAYFRDPTSGAVETPPLDPTLWLPRLLRTSAANIGILLAVVLAIALWLLFERTRTGKRMEAAGLQPAFAEYLGIRSGRYLLLSLLGSGALAGLGGGIAVLGITHAYTTGFSPQYGFLGITVALIGRLKPFGILLAALLYSSLITGATVMQSATDVPFSLVFILQGVLILLITSRRGGTA
jgi:general nucleoside transport system permease protein